MNWARGQRTQRTYISLSSLPVADPDIWNRGSQKGKGWGLGRRLYPLPRKFVKNFKQNNAFSCKIFTCFGCIQSIGKAAAPRPSSMNPPLIITNNIIIQSWLKWLNAITFHIANPSQSYGASPAVWDHTCHPTQMSAPRLNPSHISRQSIYLSRRDERLS